VDRIVRVSGRDALVKLIRSYADGVSDDDAFKTALGKDVAGFEADWLGELGAKPPSRRGPRPAPAGPLPAGWSGPQPDPSFEVVGSLPPVNPSAPAPNPRGGDDPVAALLRSSVAAIGAVLLVVLLVIALRRAQRRSDAMAASADAPGDNRLFGRPIADGGGEPGGAGDGPPDGPSSALWTTTSWSLPKDPGAGPDGPVAPRDEEPPLQNPER
jgi:hypothetical protein